MNLSVFLLTLICLISIIGMTSISLSIVFEHHEPTRYIPTRPTQQPNESANKYIELDKDIEVYVASMDDEEEDDDIMIADDLLE